MLRVVGVVPLAGRVCATRHGVPLLGCMAATARHLSGFAKPIKLFVPDTVNGVVTVWNKELGAEVAAGESLCEIETEDYAMEFDAQSAGFLAKILAPAGTAVQENQPLALMVPSKDDLDGVRLQDMPPNKVTPSARHLMLSSGLSAADLAGTGKHGRITKGDVLVALGKVSRESLEAARSSSSGGARHHAPEPLPAAESQPPSVASAPAASPSPAAASSSSPPPSSSSSSASPSSSATQSATAASSDPFAGAPSFQPRPGGGTYTDTAPNMMRKVIARRMTESKTSVPHFYATIDCRIDDMLAFRKTLKAAGVGVSVNDLVVKAAARALRAVPEVNCRFDDASGTIVENDSVDVSVAVSTPGGLITPIVKDADRIGLYDINSAVKDLATRGRNGKLAPEEYQGGTFTISNLGMFNIDEFTAVINAPQSTIMAVGGGVPSAVVDGDGNVTTATVMTVQVSCDRRVVDESLAGQFLQAFQTLVQTPALLSG